MNERESRRAFLTVAGVLLVACRKGERAAEPPPKAGSGEEVSATEDLMREHGVIRRILVIYRETAMRLRTQPASVPPDALQKAARVMRSFGEDYHEKQLEEMNIFPALVKGSGPLTGLVNTLIAQHQRGREITEYILAVTEKAIGPAAEPLARTLEAFARMYEDHAALEDTIVFPAWKKALTPKEVADMGDRFEDIEQGTFGKDGFDEAVGQVAAIETTLGIELAGMTAPAPPRQ
jgi:hemerythrin-like domain-containing protein